MQGLATIACLTSLAFVCVGALPGFPSSPKEDGLTSLEKSLAEIDSLGHRDNDIGELMLESGEENDVLSRLLFNRQTEKLGLRQGRLREKRGKKSKEKHRRRSKEMKRGKSKEKKHRKSKEKKHREKCGRGRGKSKERYPCTTSVTTTDIRTTPATSETSTFSTGTTTTSPAPTSPTTTASTTELIPTVTTTTMDMVTFTEPFESSEEVETLIPFFPDGVDDGFFPYILLEDSEPFV